jgi:hypothetical protein
VELLKQYHLAGNPSPIIILFRKTHTSCMKIVEFEATIEFVANINEQKDCLMSQDKNYENPEVLWFNIDVPKGHGVKAGDRVRVTVEKI